MAMLAALGTAGVWRLPPEILLPLARAQAGLNACGVFVTIERQQDGKSKVHGCMGHYSLKHMPPEDLLEAVPRKARSAAFEDQRASGFPRSLLQDATARLQVSVLLRPLVQLRPESGRPLEGGSAFSPQHSGVLVFGKNGATATYLPGVFPEETSWEEVRDSLLQKASISEQASDSWFFSYATLTQSCPLTRPYDGPYGRAVVGLYASWCSRFFVGDVPPYSVSEQGKVEYIASEKVRNSAVSATLVHLSVTGSVRNRAKAYLRALRADRETTAQALAVGGSFSPAHCLNNTHMLLSAEPNFELPQLLHACQEACEDVSVQCALPQHPFRQRVLRLESPTDLFFMNHAVKALCWSGSAPLFRELGAIFLACANELSGLDDTNLLAVAFECGCFLSVFLPEDENLAVRLTEIFALLMPRFNLQIGLFAFRNGDCRVDITDHVVRALQRSA